MDKNILGYYINPSESVFKPLEITDDLYTYYDILDCRCIDITHVKIAGHVYAVVCDDEGLLKDNPLPAIVRPDACIVGACFVTLPSDDDGNLQSLTDYDIKLLDAFRMPLHDFSKRFGVESVLVALG